MGRLCEKLAMGLKLVGLLVIYSHVVIICRVSVTTASLGFMTYIAIARCNQSSNLVTISTRKHVELSNFQLLCAAWRLELREEIPQAIVKQATQPAYPCTFHGSSIIKYTESENIAYPLNKCFIANISDCFTGFHMY